MTFLNTIEHSLRNQKGSLLLGLVLAFGAAELCAETISVPVGQQGQALNIDVPPLGKTKSQVQAQFGEPAETRGPVGTPPIYTWEYAQFTVYFEGDRVIHSVVKHSSPAN